MHTLGVKRLKALTLLGFRIDDYSAGGNFVTFTESAGGFGALWRDNLVRPHLNGYPWRRGSGHL